MSVIYEGERFPSEKPIFKYNYEVFPLGTFTIDKFDWRMNIKVGDYVDYEFQKSFWKKVKVIEVEDQGEIEKSEKIITL